MTGPQNHETGPYCNQNRPRLFRMMVHLRVRLPVAPVDSARQLWDGVAHRFGNHSRACPFGGGRVKRHNRLRSVLAARAQAASLGVEVEKPGLLPRPADVWVAQCGQPLSISVLAPRSVTPLSPALLPSRPTRPANAEAYEARKRTHLGTALRIRRPALVAEACSGGWGPTAAAACRVLGGLLAARSGDTPSAETDRLPLSHCSLRTRERFSSACFSTLERPPHSRTREL